MPPASPSSISRHMTCSSRHCPKPRTSSRATSFPPNVVAMTSSFWRAGAERSAIVGPRGCMSSFADVAQRMRDAWNRMAREDARFYIAFGRRDQEDEEFAVSATDVLRRIGEEFARLEPAPTARRFLEIGCGIGRLMAPLSAHCGEIHGVDIADDMIALGRARMAGVAHAYLHWTPDSDLSAFADASFDLVYSYAVMQHLPDEAPF